MPFKIIRNDITKMNTEAIVNTANDHAAVGTGCDSAVYEAAGYQELLEYRKKHIGFVEEGGAFITPGFSVAGEVYYPCSKSILCRWKAWRREETSLLLQQKPAACEGERG